MIYKVGDYYKVTEDYMDGEVIWLKGEIFKIIRQTGDNPLMVRLLFNKVDSNAGLFECILPDAVKIKKLTQAERVAFEL